MEQASKTFQFQESQEKKKINELEQKLNEATVHFNERIQHSEQSAIQTQ